MRANVAFSPRRSSNSFSSTNSPSTILTSLDRVCSSSTTSPRVPSVWSTPSTSSPNVDVSVAVNEPEVALRLITRGDGHLEHAVSGSKCRLNEWAARTKSRGFAKQNRRRFYFGRFYFGRRNIRRTRTSGIIGKSLAEFRRLLRCCRRSKKQADQEGDNKGTRQLIFRTALISLETCACSMCPENIFDGVTIDIQFSDVLIYSFFARSR